MNKEIVEQKKFMNTTITIKVVQQNEYTVTLLDGINEAFSEFDRIVKKYTRFNEDSELSNLNRNGGNWVQVSEEFLYLIEYMINLANLTEGAFDPTIIDFLEVYGYDKDYNFSKLDNPRLDDLVKKIINNRHHFSEIEIDKKNHRVKLMKDQKIDLGGVGKGYAIDCAYKKLAKVTDNFLIDAGGDVRVSGENKLKKKWQISLLHMGDSGSKEDIGVVELSHGESLSCSGSWARKFKQFHHLINPKTGIPQEERKTVYVKASSGIDSDGWATAIFIGGEKVVKKAPSTLEYFYL